MRSYAKLNLFLKVLRLRADGYHELDTLFERISLFDTVRLIPRRDTAILLECDSSELPRDPSLNLAYLAARLLQDTFKVKAGVRIEISKRIPVGAGLAGGSSNAASVLVGLNRLWRLGLSRDALSRLGARLGSDVPFFIHDTSFACGRGRGERIRRLNSLSGRRLWHVLVVPKIRVLTPDIYKGWDKLVKKDARYRIAALTRPHCDVKILLLALRKNDPGLLQQALFNSLQEVSGSFYPQVLKAQQALTRLGIGPVLMSGSGPAVFGIVPTRKEAAAFYAKLKDQKNNWRVYIVHTR